MLKENDQMEYLLGKIGPGQTSLSDPLSAFETLFVNTIKGKEWFRSLFKAILKQCKEELE